MRHLLFLSFVFLGLHGFAQDDDYYKSRSERKSDRLEKKDELKTEKFPHHRKLTLEVFGNASLTQVNDMYHVFEKTTPGIGADGGVGLRVRLYHKLALSIGGTYSNKPFDVEFPVTDPAGNIGQANLIGRLQYAGVYMKILLEFTPKFWMGLHLEKTWMFDYAEEGDDITALGQTFQYPDLHQIVFTGGFIDQFDIGLNIGMRFPILDPVYIKPFVGIEIATEGIGRTGLYTEKFPFGNVGEVNPGFIHLKLGVILEIPMLSPKPAGFTE